MALSLKAKGENLDCAESLRRGVGLHFYMTAGARRVKHLRRTRRDEGGEVYYYLKNNTPRRQGEWGLKRRATEAQKKGAVEMITGRRQKRGESGTLLEGAVGEELASWAPVRKS